MAEAGGLPWTAWLLMAAAVGLGPLIELGFLLRVRRRRGVPPREGKG